MEFLHTLEGMGGLINLIIVGGVVPILRMSHQITKIQAKLELWEDTLKRCQRRRADDAGGCQS